MQQLSVQHRNIRPISSGLYLTMKIQFILELEFETAHLNAYILN